MWMDAMKNTTNTSKTALAATYTADEVWEEGGWVCVWNDATATGGSGKTLETAKACLADGISGKMGVAPEAITIG